MKANDYIKNYGWICAGIKIAEIEHSKDFDGFYLDLKSLVESHELVMEFGDNSSYLKEHLLRNPTIKEFYLDDWCRTFSVVRLKQAIADVESCM